MIYLKRLFFKLLRKTPADMEMVRYWKHGGSVQAKVSTLDGAAVMYLDGEKYPFPGFPRGQLLFGTLSKLKHEVKNQIFNESWALLEEGATGEEVYAHVQEVLPGILELLEAQKYQLVPQQKMCASIRELYRAWQKVAPGSKVCEMVCFILQEDDAYRFRFQWLSDFMGFGSALKKLERGFTWLEHGEVIGDMKERVRLVRRILLTLLAHPKNRAFIAALFKEIDWKKIRLSRADKYYFRGKYFKVDLDKFEY